MSPSRSQFTTRGWMAVVGAYALILTLVAWPVVAGVTAILVLFSPFLAECHNGVRRLRRSSRVVSRTGTQPPQDNVEPDLLLARTLGRGTMREPETSDLESRLASRPP
jgi:hypothetical protein